MPHSTPTPRPSRIILFSFFVLLTTNVFAQPILTSFSPASGSVGSTVTITGSNFSATPANNVVYFGSSKARVIGATSTTLSVVIPTGASYQPITVTTGGLTGSSRLGFDITFSGAANSFLSDSFSVPKMTGVTGGLMTTAIADCNGDGLPEVATPVGSGGSNFCYIYQNGTSGSTFYFSSIKTLPAMENSVVFADLNGDSLLDYIGANSGSAMIDIYKNTSVINGSVNFTIDGPGASPSAIPAAIAVADLDLDGRPDVISANIDATLSIMRNVTASPSSTIYLDVPLNITTVSGYKNITTGDLDGDGKPDILVTNRSGSTMTVFRNTSVAGTISFAAGQDLTTGNGPYQAVVGDLDNDGKPDVAVVNRTDKSLILFYNTSTVGSIALHGDSVYSTGNWNPTGVAIGDIDGDGKPDVAVSTTDAATLNMTQSYPIMLYKNAGGPGATHLLPGVAIPGDYSNYSIDLADMNGDGRLDLVSADNAGRTFNVRLNGIGAGMPPPVDTPHILSFTPTSGTTGTVVTIKGQKLSHAVNVLFGPYPALSVTVISDSVLTATVGGGEVSNHSVYLTYADGRDSLTGFTFIPPAGPLRIWSFSPTSGRTGDTIRIKGQTFATAQQVHFGTVQARSFTIADDSVLYAIVGNGASGRVEIVGNYGVDSLAGFTFIDSVSAPDTTTTPPVTPPDSTTPPAPSFHLQSFTATGGGANITLQWQTANDQRIAYYVVGHAFDSTHFSVVATVSSFGLKTAVYIFVDSAMRTGTNYYRLTMIDTAGYKVDSAIAAITVPGLPQMLKGYPNPAVGSLYVPVPASTIKSTITISDMSGHVVRTIVLPPGTGYMQVDIHGLNKGVYKIMWSNGLSSAFQTVLVWN